MGIGNTNMIAGATGNCFRVGCSMSRTSEGSQTGICYLNLKYFSSSSVAEIENWIGPEEAACFTTFSAKT